MWNWGSPVAWAVFIVSAGITLTLVSWSFDWFSRAVARLASIPFSRKK